MANDTKHTPGPWKFGETQDSLLIEALVDPKNSDTYYAPIAHVDGEWTTAQANARLIAAVPEMLACLKAWIEAEQDAHFEEQAHDAEGCRYCESLAAINKAEGR